MSHASMLNARRQHQKTRKRLDVPAKQAKRLAKLAPMEKEMLKSALLVVALLISGSAIAGAKCPEYPKNEWMTEAHAKAKLEAEGYKISKFKVDGNCYEIYGTNKDGKKAEVYFDAKTLAVVKAEIAK